MSFAAIPSRKPAQFRRTASALPRTAIALAISLVALQASAAGFDLGNAAGFGIVSAGAGSSITINSGPITGNVLVGDGTSVSTSGGGNGQIIGLISDDGSVPMSAFAGLQTPPTPAQFVFVTPSFVVSAVASAKAVSDYAASLVPTLTIAGTIHNAQTFVGNGGVTVIDVTNIQNAPLTFSGGVNDFFVVNVAGNYSTNVGMTLSGVSANHVLFNFLGTSGNVFQTSGGDLSYGTYLAADGGNFQFSALKLTGSLINTAGKISFVSNSTMTAAPLMPIMAVPEPGTYAMLLAGLGVLGFARMRRSSER